MKYLFSFIAFFFLINTLQAQTISGLVINGTDGIPLPNVSIQNINNAFQYANTDASGRYTIRAKAGDSLRLNLLGFTTRILVFTGDNERWLEHISLMPESMILDTIVIRKELSQYQKDSLARRQLYGSALDSKPNKIGLNKYDPVYGGYNDGRLGLNAPISGFLDKKSKEYKRLKAFKKMYAQDEQEAFIESRYTPELVTKLTQIKDQDSVATFMITNPISYQFCKQASDLELMMKIKYNYRQWIKNPVAIPANNMPNIEADTLHKE